MKRKKIKDFLLIFNLVSLFRCRILHPYQDRIITVRESARIQGFPDTFSFSNCKKKEKYHAIGK